MDIISGFLIDQFKDKLFGSSAKNDQSVTNGEDDWSNMITEHPTMVALGMAIAAGYADGDDGFVGATLKGIFDFAATNDAADGDAGLASELWMSYRIGSIAAEQTGSGLAGLAAGISAYFGIGKWEDHHQNLQLAPVNP